MKGIRILALAALFIASTVIGQPQCSRFATE